MTTSDLETHKTNSAFLGPSAGQNSFCVRCAPVPQVSFLLSMRTGLLQAASRGLTRPHATPRHPLWPRAAPWRNRADRHSTVLLGDNAHGDGENRSEATHRRLNNVPQMKSLLFCSSLLFNSKFDLKVPIPFLFFSIHKFIS